VIAEPKLSWQMVKKMKGKRVAVIFLLSIVLAVLAVLIIHRTYKRSYYIQDSKWLKFGKAAGFLNSSRTAIDNYIKALEILKEHGIDIEFFDKHNEEEEYPAIPNAAVDEFVKLIIRGAKARRLGIKLKKPEPLTIEMYTPNGKKFGSKHFKLLAKTIEHLAKVELTQNGDIDKAIRLGYANLALGVQLSAYHNIDFIHMLGIACKTLGLQTLEGCAKAQHDENLIKIVLEMRRERDKEFEIIKNMPPTVPSFWDFFRQCMKSKSDVNEKKPTDCDNVQHAIE